MSSREHPVNVPDSMFEAAASWHARLRRAAGSTERAAFKVWVRSDPRHLCAFAEVERLFGVLELPTLQVQEELDGRASIFGWRKTERAAALTALAAGLVAVIVGAGLWGSGSYDRWRSDAATLAGESRQLHFDDGSEVTLNTDSAITYDFRDSVRNVELLRGEAYFCVAANANRPFVVSTAQGEIRVVGTRFNVRATDAVTTVSVDHGSVEVAADGPSSVRLVAGQQADIADHVSSMARSFDTATTSAWREGRLVFFGTPLREVVAELNRYRAGRIVVMNGAMQAQTVSGVFEVGDPESALHTIEQALGAKSLSIAGVVTLIYRSPE